MNEPLQKTLADAVDFLESRRIDYILVGGLAASLRGQTRATADVDLVAIVDVDDALAIVDELGDSAFAPLFNEVREVVQRALILPLRHRQTGVKVDIALGLSGFERQAVARATHLMISGRRIAVATAEDLLVMKTLAGRPQDQQDIAGIVTAQRGVLDWEYCIAVATELGKAIDQNLLEQIRRLRDEAERES